MNSGFTRMSNALTPDSAASAIRVAWITFGLFWLASAGRVKGGVPRESAGSRVVHLAVAGMALLVAFYVRWGWLGLALLPGTKVVLLVAVVLAWVGVLFAIWARVTLGRNWSAAVTLKHSHELIQSGPYRYARHPIYSGMLLSVLGVVLFLNCVAAIAGLLLLLAAYTRKARNEEILMREHFGDRWTAYCSRTRALIPFVL